MAGRNRFWSRLIGRARRGGAAMPDWVREERKAFERTFPGADSSRFESPDHWPELARRIEEIRASEARMAALPPCPEGRIVPDEELIEWLATKGPREWHLSAIDWNWDKGLGPLPWILRQPACDRGTAIAIFSAAQPDMFALGGDEEWRRRCDAAYADIRAMVVELCERWAAGQYRDYRFDPEDLVRGVRPELMPWPVPEDLVRAERQGETLDRAFWEEGVPSELIYGPPPEDRSGG